MMTYRCNSCGSNATADLQCDYCGSGTASRNRTAKSHNARFAPLTTAALEIPVVLLGLSSGLLIAVIMEVCV